MSSDAERDEKRLKVRNIVTAVLVIIFFTGIITMYYRMLYNEKRNNIIKNGEMTAREAAELIDRYLTTNTASVKLAAYTLDEMIREGRTDEEIQDYLVGQSTAVRAAIIENSTGLYGYINGRFFSGTNWEPPGDYDATKRPWYLRPMEHPGEITILDPYFDVQSGNVMLALGKTLCDGVSVISVDVSLDQIQNLTEEAVKNGDSDMEMILNDKGTVVAHSDKNEVGKNYPDDKGSLGSEIADRLNKGNSYFEFIYNGANYIVYVEDMQNGWSCISVYDATGVFGSLRSIMIWTITVVIAIVLVISLLMTRSNRYLRMSSRAIAASEAKSEFLSQMSHEIRTPINAMMGMNEMILRESNDASIRTYSENVKTAGRHLLGLVDEILDYSGMDKDKKEDEAGNRREDYDTSYWENIAIKEIYHEKFIAPDARILVVDDNPMNIMVFKSLVKQTKAIIDTANSGDEGIRLTAGNRYDIIFLDHMMPEKDGIETLHEIKGNPANPNKTTPAICLTANAIPGAKEKYISEGFDDYLTKPVDPDALDEMILEYLPEDMVIKCSFDEDAEEGDDTELPEAVKAISSELIDTDRGLRNSGTVESYLALLKVFYEDIDGKTGELNRFYEEEDYRNYTIKVHALKSSARIIGAGDLGEEAQRLENAGKAGDIEYIKSHHETFINRYNSFKEPLSSVFPAPDSDHDKPEADADLMEGVMEEIMAAAEDMDCEKLDSIFEEMGDYRIPEKSRDLYEKLKDASEKYEYKTILKLIGEEWHP